MSVPTPFIFPQIKAGDTYQAIDLYFKDTVTLEPKVFPVGTTGLAQIRDLRTKALLLSWTVTVVSNQITLEELTPSQTQNLKEGVHSLEVEATTPDGRRVTWIADARICVLADRAYG